MIYNLTFEKSSFLFGLAPHTLIFTLTDERIHVNTDAQMIQSTKVLVMWRNTFTSFIWRFHWTHVTHENKVDDHRRLHTS